MPVFHYVNEKHEFAKVVVSGDRVEEVGPKDLTFFVARPDEEMEVYAKVRPGGPSRLVESGKVGKLASRVRLI